MTVTTKTAPATRSIQLEVEVSATPEQVWLAIATGPGITAWFVPTDVDERKGGAITFHLDPGMDSTGVVTAWEPPRRFAYEERDWMPGAPPLATEFLIEARSGGLCVVRLVSSLFASSAEWDDQLESFETGWRPFLQILWLYLMHFPGQRSLVGHYTSSDRVRMSIHLYLFGDLAPAVVARDEPAWRAWMDERFPSARTS